MLIFLSYILKNCSRKSSRFRISASCLGLFASILTSSLISWIMPIPRLFIFWSVDSTDLQFDVISYPKIKKASAHPIASMANNDTILFCPSLKKLEYENLFRGNNSSTHHNFNQISDTIFFSLPIFFGKKALQNIALENAFHGTCLSSNWKKWFMEIGKTTWKLTLLRKRPKGSKEQFIEELIA